MCCQRSTPSGSTVVALLGAVATMAAVSAAASAIATAASLAATVVSFAATVVVTMAATSFVAAAVYVAARLVAAIAMTRPDAVSVDAVPEIGPGAIAALPAGDTIPLTFPARVVEAPR